MRFLYVHYIYKDILKLPLTMKSIVWIHQVENKKHFTLSVQITFFFSLKCLWLIALLLCWDTKEGFIECARNSYPIFSCHGNHRKGQALLLPFSHMDTSNERVKTIASASKRVWYDKALRVQIICVYVNVPCSFNMCGLYVFAQFVFLFLLNACTNQQIINMKNKITSVTWHHLHLAE